MATTYNSAAGLEGSFCFSTLASKQTQKPAVLSDSHSWNGEPDAKDKCCSDVFSQSSSGEFEESILEAPSRGRDTSLSRTYRRFLRHNLDASDRQRRENER